jgi:cytochrome b6-f complex iron-sulfur subunit
MISPSGSFKPDKLLEVFMERRQFLKLFSVGWVASSLPVAIAVSTDLLPLTESANAQSNRFQAIATVSELNKKGQILKLKTPLGNVLIVRTAQKVLTAVDPACPHANCLVDWQKAANQFICPCHGSKFDGSGKILAGSAAKSLKTYPVKIQGDSILIKA